MGDERKIFGAIACGSVIAERSDFGDKRRVPDIVAIGIGDMDFCMIGASLLKTVEMMIVSLDHSPHSLPIIDRKRPGLILVGGSGERFVNIGSIMRESSGLSKELEAYAVLQIRDPELMPIHEFVPKEKKKKFSMEHKNNHALTRGQNLKQHNRKMFSYRKH